MKGLVSIIDIRHHIEKIEDIIGLHTPGKVNSDFACQSLPVRAEK